MVSRPTDGCRTGSGECRAGSAPRGPRSTEDARPVVSPLRGHSGEGGNHRRVGACHRSALRGRLSGRRPAMDCGNGTSPVPSVTWRRTPRPSGASLDRSRRCGPWPRLATGSSNLTGLRRGPTQARRFLAGLGFQLAAVRADPGAAQKNLPEHVRGSAEFLDGRTEAPPGCGRRPGGPCVVRGRRPLRVRHVPVLPVVNRAVFVRAASGRQRFNVLGRGMRSRGN